MPVNPKFLRKSLLALAPLMLAAQVNAAPLSLTASWTTTDLATPESTLVSQLDGKDVIFVSLIDGQGDAADGKGGIALLDASGKVIDGNFITGLDAPKGMAQVGNKLYVSDIQRIHVIDIAAKKVEATYAVEGSQFLNDLTADDKGRVYISDSRANRVYRLDDGKVSLYLDNIENANGVLAEGDDLWVTSALKLLKVDSDKNIQVVADEGFLANLDGLVRQSDSRLIATSWAGVIYQIDLESEGKAKVTVLQDVRGKHNTADIGISGDKKTLYVPKFFANSVTAYNLGK